MIGLPCRLVAMMQSFVIHFFQSYSHTLVRETFLTSDRSKCEAVVKAIMEVGVVKDGDLQWLAAEE